MGNQAQLTPPWIGALNHGIDEQGPNLTSVSQLSEHSRHLGTERHDSQIGVVGNDMIGSRRIGEQSLADRVDLAKDIRKPDTRQCPVRYFLPECKEELALTGDDPWPSSVAVPGADKLRLERFHKGKESWPLGHLAVSHDIEQTIGNSAA